MLQLYRPQPALRCRRARRPACVGILDMNRMLVGNNDVEESRTEPSCLQTTRSENATKRGFASGL